MIYKIICTFNDYTDIQTGRLEEDELIPTLWDLIDRGLYSGDIYTFKDWTDEACVDVYDYISNDRMITIYLDYLHKDQWTITRKA